MKDYCRLPFETIAASLKEVVLIEKKYVELKEEGLKLDTEIEELEV